MTRSCFISHIHLEVSCGILLPLYSFCILVLNISCLYFSMGIGCELILYSPVEDFVQILLLHTPIEYFTSLFHHDYGCKLILYSPVKDFVHILLSHTRIEYFMCVFQHVI